MNIKADKLARQILEDQQRHAERVPRERRELAPGADFDPYDGRHTRVIAGGDPGYLVKTPMRKGSVGFHVACRCCGNEFESLGMAYCKTCLDIPADERRTIKPTVQGRLCQAPGCETFIPRRARADVRYCSKACRERAYRARKEKWDG